MVCMFAAYIFMAELEGDATVSTLFEGCITSCIYPHAWGEDACYIGSTSASPTIPSIARV